jgi:hypothetical protein
LILCPVLGEGKEVCLAAHFAASGEVALILPSVSAEKEEAAFV